MVRGIYLNQEGGDLYRVLTKSGIIQTKDVWFSTMHFLVCKAFAFKKLSQPVTCTESEFDMKDNEKCGEASHSEEEIDSNINDNNGSGTERLPDSQHQVDQDVLTCLRTVPIKLGEPNSNSDEIDRADQTSYGFKNLRHVNYSAQAVPDAVSTSAELYN